MLPNDNLRKDGDGNIDARQKRLREEAVKETEGAKIKMRFEEETRKRLKISGKKRQSEELKRKIALLESVLSRSERELTVLNAEREKIKRRTLFTNEDIRKNNNELNVLKTEQRKIEQEVKVLMN